MSNVDAPTCPGGFQYRLRFFHKCRSACGCDYGQPDRFQVQGSAIESTCGGPLIVVLVRYKHDPEGGLSKDCRRAQLAPGKPQFAIKTIVVPSDRVLEYMDKPLLQQPRLADAQGRNLLGGPDVSPDGCIYVTPMEQSGIAHLDNFTFMLPWSEQTASMWSGQVPEPQQDMEAAGSGPCMEGLVLDRNSNSRSGLCGDSRRCGEGGGASFCPELCLLVQLLKRSTDEPGKWNVYGMPHLVSRPFQVIPRSALPTHQHPSAMLHPQATLQVQQQLNQQQLLLLQQRRQQAVASLEQQAPGAFAGYGSGTTFGLLSQQQQGLRMGMGVAGGATAGASGGMGGMGPLKARRSSCSSGSPHAGGTPRGSRPRRRSCLAKDTSHDDVTAIVPPPALNPIRTRSGVSGTDMNASLVSTPMGADSSASAPLPSTVPLSPHGRLSHPSPRARPGTPRGPMGQASLRAKGSIGVGLPRTPESRVAALNTTGLQDLLDGLAAQALVDDDVMDLECPQKRVRSNVTTADVAAFMSDNSSSSLLTPSQASTLAGQPHSQQLQMAPFPMPRGGNSSVSAPLPLLNPQQLPQGNGCGGGGTWSLHTTGSGEQLMKLKRQAGGPPYMSATGFTSALASSAACGSAGLMVVGDGGVTSAVGDSSSWDALVQLLDQPGAMQDALDRMDLEQQQEEQQRSQQQQQLAHALSQEVGQEQCSGSDSMQM